MLVLLLLAAGLAPPRGDRRGHGGAGAPEPWVTPASVHEALDPGGSTGVDKQVRTPAIPPKPDVVLLVDGTLSMKDAIQNVKTGLEDVTTTVREQQPDSQFAVATYGDEKNDPTAEFEVLQGLTADLELVLGRARASTNCLSTLARRAAGRRRTGSTRCGRWPTARTADGVPGRGKPGGRPGWGRVEPQSQQRHSL
ncbi:hypothetical protein NKH18_26855 [Streptomyces sp. M10(2022)]